MSCLHHATQATCAENRLASRAEPVSPQGNEQSRCDHEDVCALMRVQIYTNRVGSGKTLLATLTLIVGSERRREERTCSHQKIYKKYEVGGSGMMTPIYR